MTQRTGAATGAANEVRLIGRVSRQPEERVLPSGDAMWSFSVVVPRAEGRTRSRQTVDALDCAAWSARSRRSVAGWNANDVVEVHGAVRRRFFKTGGGAASRFEIEVTRGRVIHRAASA
ncbi:MAG: single-stranded DNA-binding protein [Nocardioides sp.]